MLYLTASPAQQLHLQGSTEPLEIWGLPTEGTRPAGGLLMCKNAGGYPPAVFEHTGARGSAPGGSQGAVKTCSLVYGGHRSSAERAGLLGSENQAGTGRAGHVVAAGVEGDAGGLVHADDTCAIVILRGICRLLLRGGDCLSGSCCTRAQLL